MRIEIKIFENDDETKFEYYNFDEIESTKIKEKNNRFILRMEKKKNHTCGECNGKGSRTYRISPNSGPLVFHCSNCNGTGRV